MTLETDLSDVTTGQRLACLVHEQNGVMGTLRFPGAVASNADCRHAVKARAQGLRTDLDEMSGQSP
jgi:hypothetical protein